LTHCGVPALISSKGDSYSLMQLLSATITAAIIGSFIVINGIVISGSDILDSAYSAANGANLHQLATVVEIYYLDHNEYPEVSGGDELATLFFEEGYIKSNLSNAEIFDYESSANGQDYILNIIE
jgi:hypothetical protein